MSRQLHFAYCHQKPERSFFFRGKQFPICARCTGIHLGYLFMPIFMFGLLDWGFWLTIALILPTYIDGTVQAYTSYRSNNFLRFTTGLMAGIGLMSLAAIIGKFLGDSIYSLYQYLF